ncbi:MAG: bifunctional phosphoglucose/phosphomannose isomerase [bacterium]|nr:bifunctional phosphoglucose/phosphomannose isomerase [bacterium]
MEIKTQNFRKIILESPRQITVGLKAGNNVKVPGKFRNGVIICGMGGSALPGSILSFFLEEARISLPLRIHRDYLLPEIADKNHLIVCISYSGNTEETLSAFKEALKKKLPLAAIASGGELSALCQENKIPFAKIPSGIPPRMALGYQFAALVKILANSNLIPSSSLNELIRLGKKLRTGATEAAGKKLAEKISQKFPVIYSSGKNKVLARIWKINFNENSKTPSFSNVFPELSHNELAGWTCSPKDFQIIILKDGSDEKNILRRMTSTAEILKKLGVAVEFVEIKGRNLEKIFNGILLGNWASYYLALKKKINPFEIKIIEDLKIKMAKSKK